MKIAELKNSAEKAYYGGLAAVILSMGSSQAATPKLSTASFPSRGSDPTLVAQKLAPLSSLAFEVPTNSEAAASIPLLRDAALQSAAPLPIPAALREIDSTGVSLLSLTGTGVAKVITGIGLEPTQAKEDLLRELPKWIVYSVIGQLAIAGGVALYKKYRELSNLASAVAHGSAVIERVTYNSENKTIELVQAGPGECIGDLWKMYPGAARTLGSAAKNTTPEDPFLRLNSKYINAIYCQLRRIVQGADAESLKKAQLLRTPVLRIPVVAALTSERVQGEKNGKRMQILIVEETLLRALKRDNAFFRRDKDLSFIRNGVPLSEGLSETRKDTLTKLAEWIPQKREPLVKRVVRAALPFLSVLRPELSQALLMTEISFALSESEYQDTVQRWKKELSSKDAAIAFNARLLLAAQDKGLLKRYGGA